MTIFIYHASASVTCVAQGNKVPQASTLQPQGVCWLYVIVPQMSRGAVLGTFEALVHSGPCVTYHHENHTSTFRSLTPDYCPLHGATQEAYVQPHWAEVQWARPGKASHHPLPPDCVLSPPTLLRGRTPSSVLRLSQTETQLVQNLSAATSAATAAMKR